MSEIEITFSDGNKKKFTKYSTYYAISKSFHMKNNILGAVVNNRIVSLYDRCENDCNVEFLDYTSVTGNRIYVAGLKMMFEYSVKKIYPEANIKFSFNLPNGFIAEIDYNKFIDGNSISNVKDYMDKIRKDDIPIEKMIVKNSDGYNFYNMLGNNVKADNIKNITDPTIVLYKLDNLINYYYSEMPYSTGVIDTYELRYLGKNIIAILFPSEYDNGKINDYVNYSGIIDAYIKGKEWLNTMNVPYIRDVNKLICDGSISNFVKSSELNFNLEINETAKYVANNPNIKYVMISGPSTSGKTTVIKRLANYFEIYGLDPVIISTDDYFKERVDTPKDINGKYDFESINALDREYLSNDLMKLLNNEEISLPEFNFVTGQKQISSKKIKLKENSIILIEGLHAINDELLPMLKQEEKYNIFVSPYIPICIDEHNYITGEDLRLLRRIVRDFRTRGYSPEKTLDSNRNVRLGEVKYLNSYIQNANKIISTSLPYELGILKVFVGPLLYSVPMSSVHYNEARRLLSFLKQFFTISSEYVPKDSILREFIGGEE